MRTLAPLEEDHNLFFIQCKTQPTAVQTPANSDLILMEEGLSWCCLFCALSLGFTDFHQNSLSGFSVKSLTY